MNLKKVPLIFLSCTSLSACDPLIIGILDITTTALNKIERKVENYNPESKLEEEERILKVENETCKYPDLDKIISVYGMYNSQDISTSMHLMGRDVHSMYKGTFKNNYNFNDCTKSQIIKFVVGESSTDLDPLLEIFIADKDKFLRWASGYTEITYNYK